MNMIKTKRFWLAVGAVVVMVLQAFGVKVDAEYVNELISAVCGVLIMVGVLANPASETTPIEPEATDTTDSRDTESVDESNE